MLKHDPFCASRCCREYHGVKLSKPEGKATRRSNKAERQRVYSRA